MTNERHFLGLDLGQRRDPSALVALRREPLPRSLWSRKRRFRYEVRGLKRWPLGTAYFAIAEDVAALVRSPPLAGCTLGIDATGVGLGVVEIIRAARPDAVLRPVLITAGHRAALDADGLKVPKLELVAAVTALLESGRLAVPATIREAKTLGKELQAFRARVTAAGRETMEADWRERAHDDLVLALAIAAYLGEHGREFWVRFDGEAPARPAPAAPASVNPMGETRVISAGRDHVDPRPGAPGWNPYRGR